MRQAPIFLTLCILTSGCVSQTTQPIPCGRLAGVRTENRSKTVVALALPSTETKLTFVSSTTMFRLRLEDVLDVLKARVAKFGYLGPEQRIRNRLTSYPPRPGFSDLSQYSAPEDFFILQSIVLELLESGKTVVVVDPRVPAESLSEVTIFRWARTAAAWREVCSPAGDSLLVQMESK